MSNLKRRTAFFICAGILFLGLTGSLAQEQPEQADEEETTLNEMMEDTGLVVTPVDLVPEIEPQVGMVSSTLLRERFEKLEKSVPLLYHEESHKYVEYFVYRKPEFTRRMLEEKNLYFPIYEERLKAHGLPEELKYLSLIESGLNPRIISVAGAGGLWQFMRATGREFGLKQDRFIDERFDPVKSTDAACRYLKQLYSIFGDWEMALASYNCGPGNIRRAIRRTGANTFWGIYPALPRETRNYVPQYVAMVYLMHYANEHGITIQEPKFAHATDTLQVNGFMDLRTFASLSGVTMDEIIDHNPQIINSYLPAYTRDFVLKVPSSKFAMFSENLAAIRDSASRAASGTDAMLASNLSGEYTTSKRTHAVRRGETLSSIARKYRVSVAQLRNWNKVKGNNIKIGQRLVVQQQVRVQERSLASSSKPVTASAKENLSQNIAAVTEPLKTVKPTDQDSLVLAGNPVAGSPVAGNPVAGNPVAAKSAQVSSRTEASRIPDTLGKVQVQQGTAEATRVAKTETGASAERNQGRIVSHTILRGETLQGIARKYEVDVNDIRENNELEGNRLYAGTKLKIVLKDHTPAPAVTAAREHKTRISKPHYHVVQEGDTLWAISQRYGLTVDKIKKVNKMKGNGLKAGMKILISG